MPGPQFSAAEVAGATWAIRSDTDVERYEFDNRGYVTASMGKVHGAVTGPVFKWHIDAEGVLRLEIGEGHPFSAMRKIAIDKYEVQVEIVRAGYSRKRQAAFAVTRNKAP